ncbi:MAG: hypothetical protein HBSAPP03_19110 [Phycisphaerae bacterium]|nr:MAG: hypothetical protein HBSAPP03_19110 [Phycisphaerae bacterium]
MLWAEAAAVLSEIGTPTAVMAIIDLKYRAGDSELGDDIARSLGDVRNSDSHELLLAVLVESQDDRVVQACTEALGASFESNDARRLAEEIESLPPSESRDRLVSLLSHVRNRRAVSGLMSLLDPERHPSDDDVLQSAATALAHADAPDAAAYLLSLIDRPDAPPHQVYEAAISINGEKAKRTLMETATGGKLGTRVETRQIAVLALANYPDETTVEFLMTLQRDDNAEVANSASHVLALLARQL